MTTRADSPRPLRDPLAAGRGRNGRGLARAGHAARARGRDQGAARGGRLGSRAAEALREGGALGLGAQPPLHRHDLRHRPDRRRLLDRDGAGRRQDAAGAAGLRRAAGEAPAPARHLRRRGPGQGARGGDRAPGPEARERHGHQGRAGQDPGLRPGEADLDHVRERRGLGPADDDGDDTGCRGRDGRLHVAGAGERRGSRFPLGSVLLRVGPLRDGDGQARLPEEDRHRHAGRDPEHGAGADRAAQSASAGPAALDRRALPRERSRESLRLDQGPGARARHGPRPPVRGRNVRRVNRDRSAAPFSSRFRARDHGDRACDRGPRGSLVVAAEERLGAPVPAGDVSEGEHLQRSVWAGRPDHRLQRGARGREAGAHADAAGQPRVAISRHLRRGSSFPSRHRARWR